MGDVEIVDLDADEQSEDGELKRSPDPRRRVQLADRRRPERGLEHSDISTDEDTGDSLDIKPPQAVPQHKEMHQSRKRDRRDYEHRRHKELRRKDRYHARQMEQMQQQQQQQQQQQHVKYSRKRESHHRKMDEQFRQPRSIDDLRDKLDRKDKRSWDNVKIKERKSEEELMRERAEKLERDRRKERFLQADRQKESYRRELEARRQRRCLEKNLLEKEKLLQQLEIKHDRSRSREHRRHRVNDERRHQEVESESETEEQAEDDQMDGDEVIVDDNENTAPEHEQISSSESDMGDTNSHESESESGSEASSAHSKASGSEEDEESEEGEEQNNTNGVVEIPEEEVAAVDTIDEKEKAENEEKEKRSKLPPYFPAIQGCRSVEEFQCLNRIEEGTYGVVYRARDKRTDEIVALKRLKMEKEKEGFPITSLREINTLLKAQHPNIVTVREIVVGSNMDKIFIVMDYVEHDLKSLMETMKMKKQVFVPGEVKCLMIQLLRAVGHLHDNWILHRDLKTSNLLLSHKGVLKVGDFGLAREYGSPLKPYTPIVVTLWYRAPELLLGIKEYSIPIDMWSVGCIFGELLTMNPLFPGKSEVDQLTKIMKDLGTPNEVIWPGYSNLPNVQKVKIPEYPSGHLRLRFGATMITDNGMQLMQRFLTYDPTKRVAAEDALMNDYFREAPLPIDPSMFPTWPAKSELGHRKAVTASPKPPSGGKEYKQLGDTDDHEPTVGFHMGGIEKGRPVYGAGFSLKF